MLDAADRRAGGATRRATWCKTPLYEARVDPDITFFGFDLTIAEAQGRRRRASPTTTPAGSSASRSGRASRGSASTSSGDGDRSETVNDLAWTDVGRGRGRDSSPRRALGTITLEPARARRPGEGRPARRRRAGRRRAGQRRPLGVPALPVAGHGRRARRRDAAARRAP